MKYTNEELQRQALITQMQSKHQTNHILHLILAVITFGIWTPFWILVAISNAIERKKIAHRAG